MYIIKQFFKDLKLSVSKLTFESYVKYTKLLKINLIYNITSNHICI